MKMAQFLTKPSCETHFQRFRQNQKTNLPYDSRIEVSTSTLPNLPNELIMKIGSSDIDAAKSLSALGQEWENFYERERINFLSKNKMYDILKSKNIPLLKQILNHGADPNQIFVVLNTGVNSLLSGVYSPLAYAISNYDTEIMQILLENKADANLEYSYYTWVKSPHLQREWLICKRTSNLLVLCLQISPKNDLTSILLKYYSMNNYRFDNCTFYDLWLQSGKITIDNACMDLLFSHGVRCYDNEYALGPFVNHLAAGSYVSMIAYLLEHKHIYIEALSGYPSVLAHMKGHYPQLSKQIKCFEEKIGLYKMSGY